MTQEEENKIFDDLLRTYGAIILEERMRKLESYRLYNRRWPFDARRGVVDIELVQDFLEDNSPDPQEQIIMTQARDFYLDGLTPKQLEVALETEKGNKPRDIAVKQGKDNSGSIRYLLHSVRKKMEEKQSDRAKDYIK